MPGFHYEIECSKQGNLKSKYIVYVDSNIDVILRVIDNDTNNLLDTKDLLMNDEPKIQLV